MATIHHIWSRFTIDGHDSPYMVTIYHIWPRFTIYGHDLPYMATIYHIWPRFTIYGHDLPYMATIYHIWPRFTIYGHDLPYMVTIYHIWPRFTIDGHDSPYMGRSTKLVSQHFPTPLLSNLILQYSWSHKIKEIINRNRRKRWKSALESRLIPVLKIYIHSFIR